MKLSLCQLLLFILVSMHYVRGRGISKRIPLSKPGGDFFYNLSPFYGPISIGTPPQNFNVSFATQSVADLWIHASFMNSSSFSVPGHSYYNHNTSYTHRCLEKCKVINNDVPLPGEGFWVADTITMDNVQITNRKFYAVTNTNELYVGPHDGCIGLSYLRSGLEENIISQFCKQLEADSKFSLHFTNDLQGTQGGELTLCEVNETKFQGELNYVNENLPGGWNILVEKISLGYGNQKKQELAVEAHTVAFIDTKTSFIKGPLEDIKKIFRGINSTNSKKNQNHQEVDCDTIHELPNILFRIGGQDYTFTGYDYILELLNDNKRVCISGFIDSGYGQQWFFGELFLRKFYTVFDMEKHRIGFAESKYYTSRPRVYKSTIMISLF